MPDIKIKEHAEKTIKVFDKSLIVADKFKDNLVSTKGKINDLTNLDEDNTNTYSSDRYKTTSSEIIDKTNNIGRKSFDKTKEKFKKIKAKDKLDKSKKISKTKKVSIKTSKEVAKKSAKVTKESVKNSEKMIKVTKQVIKGTVKVTKATIKATISVIKAAIKATEALVEAIIAGGWVAIIIILVICMIGLLVSSIYGIFFTNDTNDGKSMSTVITEINNEVNTKVENIKRVSTYDELRLNIDNSSWKEVLAIYSVKYNFGKELIITLSESNINKIKEIYWYKNEIIYEIKEETTEDLVVKKVLYISMKSKSLDELMTKYNFTEYQKKQVSSLLDTQYDNEWKTLLYGSSSGNVQIVNIALQEVGYTHGDKYWSWYGFNSRVEWCAVFISWLANQEGVLNTSIPKFSGVADGINWFKQRGQWQEPGYIPKAGDIIFFDWEPDGKSNHVGLVDHVENNIIYTVEGNSTDDGVRQKSYNINSNVIYGFGIPTY